jgi:hypothetical protein
MLRPRRIFPALIGLLLGVACDETSSPKRSSGDRGTGNPEAAVPPNAAPTTPTGDSALGTPAAASADEADAPLIPVPYQAFDINHVVSTGQSNSVAHEGIPPLSTTQPANNLMFDVGVMTSGDCDTEGCKTYQKPTSFVPLVEGDTFWYPVETMSSGLANLASQLATTTYQKPSHSILMSLAGRNGLTYWCLRSGGCNFISGYMIAFDENMKQVDDALAIAKATGKTYVVRAVTSIHGESDDYAYATNTQEFPLDGTDGSSQTVRDYTDGLLEWQHDYETAIKAKTGQTLAIPLLISQHSGWNDIATSAVAEMQYDAHVRSKGKVVLVAPGYPLDYSDDCRHYTNNGERQLGEYFAKAYARIVLEGLPWEPVHPKKVALSGDTITAKYYVPKPPLVLDTTRVTDPGNFGFAVVDAANNAIPIANVTLDGPDTVKIKLSTTPSGATKLRYAYTGIPHTCPGKTQGPRGNLRDSDDTRSPNGYDLFNWGVHYEVPVQ